METSAPNFPLASNILSGDHREQLMEEEAFRKLSEVTHFHLPPISCSIPFECHPSFASICEKVDKWGMEALKVQGQQQQRKFVQDRVNLFASMILPGGTEERLILLAQHAWMYLMFDDIIELTTEDDEFGAMSAKALELAAGTMNTAALENEEHAAIWYIFDTVWSKMRLQMPPSLFSRYLGCLAKYLGCVREEVRHRKDNLVMDGATYRVARRDTAYMESIGGLGCEFSMGIELQQEDIESSTFVDFINAVTDHVAMVNDLLSFRREYYMRCSHNWLVVLFYHGGCNDFQSAVDRLCEMIQEEETNILRLQKLLQDKASQVKDEHLMRFATALPLAVAGNLRWSYVTARYHGYDNPWITGEPFHGTLLMHPEATIVMPPRKCQPHPFLLDLKAEDGS